MRCCPVSFGFGYRDFPKDRLRADDGLAADSNLTLGVLDGDTLTLTHKVIEGDTNDAQSLGSVLASAGVLTATRKR